MGKGELRPTIDEFNPLSVIERALGIATGNEGGHLEKHLARKIVEALIAADAVLAPLEPTRALAFGGANTVRNFNKYEGPGMAVFEADMRDFGGDKTTVRSAALYRGFARHLKRIAAEALLRENVSGPVERVDTVWIDGVDHG